MIRIYLIAVVAGLAAATAVYQGLKFKWKTEGAVVERARTANAEGKIGDKIDKRQRAIAKQPPSRVLDKWSTD